MPEAQSDAGGGSAIVSNEMAAAGEFLRKGDADVARLLYRNALALEMMTASESGERTRTGKIQEMITRCGASAARVKRECRSCGGNGKRVVEITGLDGEVRKSTSGLPCLVCGGSGTETAEEPILKRRERLGQAMRRYTEFQRGRKYASMGMVWIPVEKEGTLSQRQTALAKRSCAAPCDKCLGLGRVGCKKCEGTGSLPCTNRECKNGQIVKENEGQISSGSLRSSAKCLVCGGKATIACQSCEGKGSVPCSECDGTGERAVCADCAGSGLVRCRGCDGTGTENGVPCRTCGGEKQIVCSSCSGDGRKR